MYKRGGRRLKVRIRRVKRRELDIPAAALPASNSTQAALADLNPHGVTGIRMHPLHALDVAAQRTPKTKLPTGPGNTRGTPASASGAWISQSLIVIRARMNMLMIAIKACSAHRNWKSMPMIAARAWGNMLMIAIRAWENMLMIAIRAWKNMPMIAIGAWKNMPMIAIRAWKNTLLIALRAWKNTPLIATRA